MADQYAAAHMPSLTENDLRAAVCEANVPALLMVVYQFTGDPRWLSARYRPERARGLTPNDSGGLPEAVQEEVREAAVDAIGRLIAGEAPAIAELSAAEAAELASVYLGEEVDPRYGALFAGELRRRASRTPAVSTEPTVPPGYRAVVIGAGVAGIVAIRHLREMGAEFTVFERGPDAGGVWRDNVYPGAGVDTPSHLYSFSFAPRDWAHHFELRDELESYLGDVLDLLEARQHVQFDSTVLSAEYDEETNTWKVIVSHADGSVSTHVCDIVISAVGSLNAPKLPRVPGMDDFAGLQFHSSHWPVDLDLAGKRVAIVGTGASAMQIAPRIGDVVDHLTIFQRSPQWVAPFELFGAAIPQLQRRLLDEVDLYRSWYWLRLFWQFGDKVIEALRVDPEWTHPERSVNARNDGHRRMFTRYIESQLDGRPDLVAKTVPDFPPFGKRILLDNGWYATLKRENVTLVTEGVTTVDPRGPITKSGGLHEVDVLVWATGFEATAFLSSVDVRGIGSQRLRDVWEEDNPKAYLGVSVPGFPNFFMLGGPHSFPGSGSFMYFMEVQMRYLRRLVGDMLQRNISAIDARKDVTDEYNELVDEVHERTIWTHPGFTTYYRNSRGRVIFVMPFLNLEYWEFTERSGLDDYTVRSVSETTRPRVMSVVRGTR